MGILCASPAQPHDAILHHISHVPPSGYSVLGASPEGATPSSACRTAVIIFWSEGSMRKPFLAITSSFTNTVNSPGFPCCNSTSIPSSVFKSSATRTARGRVEVHPIQYRMTTESIRVSSFKPSWVDSLWVIVSPYLSDLSLIILPFLYFNYPVCRASLYLLKLGVDNRESYASELYGITQKRVSLCLASTTSRCNNITSSRTDTRSAITTEGLAHICETAPSLLSLKPCSLFSSNATFENKQAANVFIQFDTS